MKKEQKQISFPSSFDEIWRIEPFVENLKKWLDLNDQLYGNIMLALSEAVTNAIVHGNKENPSKSVKIKAKVDNNTLKISVRDEGEGFDPEELPDPLKEENLMNEGGRGVFLIREYADNIQFFDDGTNVVIHFDLD